VRRGPKRFLSLFEKCRVKKGKGVPLIPGHRGGELLQSGPGGVGSRVDAQKQGGAARAGGQGKGRVVMGEEGGRATGKYQHLQETLRKKKKELVESLSVARAIPIGAHLLLKTLVAGGSGIKTRRGKKKGNPQGRVKLAYSVVGQEFDREGMDSPGFKSEQAREEEEKKARRRVLVNLPRKTA